MANKSQLDALNNEIDELEAGMRTLRDKNDLLEATVTYLISKSKTPPPLVREYLATKVKTKSNGHGAHHAT